MTTLHIIRHAEAEGNVYRRAHGQYNSLLTPNGRAQVEALRTRFADTVFDEVYCSDLYRAQQTATALRTAAGAPARPVQALREINLGDWEDTPWGELAVADAAQYGAFARDPWRFERRGPQGETMQDALTRAWEALRGIARAHPGGTVALTSHGMVIRLLMAKLSGLPMERLTEIAHCDNTGVACVRWDGTTTPDILFMGDNTHLGVLSTLGRQHWWRKDNNTADANLWFVPADLPRQLPQTLACREEAWMAVYGSLYGFSPGITAENTMRMASANPRAVLFAMLEDKLVGLLELDVDAVTPDNTGHISLVYLYPEVRGKGLGMQMVGQAVSFFRALGRRALHLRVAETNLAARALYAKMGFVETGREQSINGKLIVMQMDIAVPPGR